LTCALPPTNALAPSPTQFPTTKSPTLPTKEDDSSDDSSISIGVIVGIVCGVVVVVVGVGVGMYVRLKKGGYTRAQFINVF
jgi:hypothetical protein